MIRFYLQEMIAERKFKTGKKVTLEMIARETGVSKVTPSRISSQRGYNTTTDNIDKLCAYFECSAGQVMEHVADKSEELLV
ncbi:MAG: helix-turn-helix domain-containing protein [Trichlorobacter sp.]|uniref:helix-turn-helix domain-containing protein n=1 Tax=Trichlorobacter sp. TaxID=2911007 RepID=UPI0025641FC5|nr:helix-turn-helix domain-containing protein [Trichlorobacter sp.]MDK9718551.1 helix-turn-helix domain-containing protein [Trichlorobacter sp.]